MSISLNTKEFSLRAVTAADAAVLRSLAAQCKPLDVHTPYTYWVLSAFFGKQCFIMYNGETPIGFISSITSEDTTFIWQIGLLKEYRGYGLSQRLIEAVADYAKKQTRRMCVTIAAANKSSKRAFEGFCGRNGLTMNECETIEVKDLIDPNFYESEVAYEIELSVNDGNQFALSYWEGNESISSEMA